MLKRLMTWMDAVPREQYEKSQNDLLVVRAELAALKAEKRKERPIISVDVGDPTPVDGGKRRMYVGSVAGFHKDYLGPKLKQMICKLREEFEKVNRDTFGYPQAEYDLYLKGAINFGWLLMEWGDEMINEQVAYQQGPDEGEIEELKDKIK